MAEVWMVIGDQGVYSDHSNWVESVWDTEAGAVSHIVRDLGAELVDPDHPRDRLTWVARDPDGWSYEDVYYEIDRKPLRHGG